MKILYLVHQFYPEHYTGTEKFVYSMASMMQKKGHQVKVITYSFYDDSFYDQKIGTIKLKRFIYKGIPVVALKHRNFPDDIHYGLRNEEMRSIAMDLISIENPDMIHVGHPMRVSELALAAKELNIPYIITLTDFFLLCPKVILYTSKGNLCAGPEGGHSCKSFCPEFSNDLINERLLQATDILFQAKKVLSPSAFVATMFNREYAGLNVRVINHGMSYSKIKKNDKIYKQNSNLTFFYGGSLTKHKGVHVLVDAFRQLRSDRISLEIYGSGPELDSLTKMAMGDNRIHFRGVFSGDQIGEIFSQVDTVIVPSLWYENYPLVLHEALACNIPVLTSNAGGMSEKIKDGEFGFTFKIGDALHLKERLQLIADNPEILNDLKDNIRNFMIPTIEQEAFAYEREYLENSKKM